MIMPAVCDNCGEIFPSSFSVKNSRNVAFRGSESGPCPKCGGQGKIPDGIYNSIGNTIELLAGPERTKTELERLAKIFKNTKLKKSSYREIIKEIEEHLPELSTVKGLLPTTRTELYAFLTIILTIITFLILNSSSKEPQKIEINNVINSIYLQIPPQKNNPSSIPFTKDPKIGRNELCNCGSGKKYKNCCIDKN